jgi:hypothetical protein
MATLTYLCKIGSTDITPYLKSYEVSYEELWSEANRNMAGNLKATFIATVPKISLQFRQMTQTEMSTVMGLLDDHTFTVYWWEEQSDTYKSGSFYRGELKVGIRDLNSKMYKDLSVNLIAFNKL